MVEDTLRFFASRRSLVADELKAFARSGDEPAGRITEFCLRGKMIRACLVFLGSELAGGPGDAAATAQAAMAMELFQAGLLAHDDIMDRDETRRGEPTVHTRYANESRSAGAADPEHAGISLGICLGDLCYFEGYAALGRALGRALRVGGREGRAARILALCSSTLSEVAAAQMSDVRWACLGEEPSEAQILSMYRGKTSRYSFSMPLALGALIEGEEALSGRLEELGDGLGLLFQLRDDELGLFGSPELTGKALGSDLREGKKTLFRSRLLAAASCADRDAKGHAELERLRDLFDGRAEAGPADLAYIRERAEALGVEAALGELMSGEQARARAIAAALPCRSPETRAALEGLVEWVTEREK